MTKKSRLFKENTITLPAVKVFKAEEELIIGKHNIAYISNETKNLINSLIERNVPAIELQSQELARVASTREIIKAIGKRGSISMAHFATLLSLRKNSFTVIVQVKGKLWAVSAGWGAGYGWYVNADSVDGPGPWDDERQVLSRKSGRDLARQ